MISVGYRRISPDSHKAPLCELAPAPMFAGSRRPSRGRLPARHLPAEDYRPENAQMTVAFRANTDALIARAGDLLWNPGQKKMTRIFDCYANDRS